jgi:hypothetical protein
MIRQAFWHSQRFPCREVIRLGSQAMDKRLTFPERVSLWGHSLLCSYCRNYIRQIGLLRRCARQMGGLAGSAFQPGLPPGSAARIKKRLKIEN